MGLKSYTGLGGLGARLLFALLFVSIAVLVLYHYHDDPAPSSPEVTTSSRKDWPSDRTLMGGGNEITRSRIRSLALKPGNLTADEKSDVLSFAKGASLDECSELVSSLTINDSYREVLYLVAERIATEDPEKALSWLSSLDLMEANTPAFTMCSKILGRDIRWLEQALTEVTNSRFREEILQHSIPQIALDDWQGAVDLVFRQDLELSAEKRAEFLISAVVRMDGEAVLGLVNEMGGEGGGGEKIGGGFWDSLLSVAGSKNADFASEFLSSNRYSEAEKIGVTATLVEKWTSQDPFEALEWVQQGNDGPLKDQAILGFVRGVWDQQPSNAIGWAASIRDSELRRKTVKNVIRRAGAESESFNRIISNLSVEPNEREEYLQFLKGIDRL